MEDWGESKSAIAGSPRMSGKILSVKEDGSSECGIWSCTPGERTVTFANDEFCFFLDGEGSYVRDDGEVIPVKKGSVIFFAKGWSGRSIITKTLSKAFMCR
ncbi:DUF861 domain-containing protein [Ciceribacter sp. L1K22]|nr:DUF861 domain-containing protein [Ciceribacter sp. L1K22]